MRYIYISHKIYYSHFQLRLLTFVYILFFVKIIPYILKSDFYFFRCSFGSLFMNTKNGGYYILRLVFLLFS
jgi:hypothetical protein